MSTAELIDFYVKEKARIATADAEDVYRTVKFFAICQRLSEENLSLFLSATLPVEKLRDIAQEVIDDIIKQLEAEQ